MRNYLTIAGRDSRDFGVYISGQGTFSAPEKAYEFYDVPGRNGAIIGNDHRLENIEVTYQCFIYADFSKNIGDFRTFLLSLNGYQELTDSYHPDEYRMAVYVGPFEPEVTAKNDAGSFELVFNCKPQRWLYSGNTVYAFVNNQPVEVKGTSIDVYGSKIDPTRIDEVVTVHSSPTESARAWATEPITLNEFTAIVLRVNGTGVRKITVTGTQANIDWVAGTGTISAKLLPLPTTGWTSYHSVTQHGITTNIFRLKVSASSINVPTPFTPSRCSHYPVPPGISTLQQFVDLVDAEKLRFAYFFPPDGYMYIYDKDHSQTSSDFLDWLASANIMVDGFVSPVSFTFTPYVPDFPNEFVTVSSGVSKKVSGGSVKREITMQYSTESDTMSNPTEFASSPLIRVYGKGEFAMDGVAVEVLNCNSFVDIDCEMMDCYEGTINRNNDVTFSTYDFPKLRPGDNEITVYDNTITLVQMTPRWWRV